jgi:hypothetical protein
MASQLTDVDLGRLIRHVALLDASRTSSGVS